MATTSPDSLRTPNPTDPYNLVADLAILASDVQAALVRRANSYIGTSAQRIAFTSAADGVHWQDTNGTRDQYVRTAGAWLVITKAPPVATGTLLHPGSSSTFVLTFPAGRFSVAPTVIVNPITADTAHNAYASGVTTTQCTVNYTRTANTNINWIAVQEP